MSDNINQNKKLFLGIDGGGSKTSFLIEDEDGNTIFYKESKGSSIDTFSYEEILANYQEVLSLPYKVDAIFAGIGGIASSEDINNFNNLLRKLPIVKEDTIINSDNDVICALYGGLNGNDGIILIAGTGSVFPHGKSGGARDKLAYNTGASLAGHSTDRSDFDREGLGKGAEYGGIPAGRSVFDHSGAPSHCGAVYRSPAVKCMDPAGAKRSVRISRLDSFTESNGKVYL